jgi:hypothetical protein
MTMELKTKNQRLAPQANYFPYLVRQMSKWFYDTSTGAALEQPIVVLLWGRFLASWLLALGERGGHKNLRGSGHLSVIPYVHGRTELYCAQACLV